MTVLTAAASGPSLFMPQMPRAIVDVAYPARNLRLFLLISAGMVGLNVLGAVIGSVSSYLFTHAGATARFSLRIRAFQALLRIPIPYVESSNTGMLLERVSQDADSLAGIFVGVIPSLVSVTVTFCAAIVLMGRISPAITLLVLLCVPAYYLINGLLALKQREWQSRTRLKAEELTTLTVETISGLPTARIYGAGRWLKRLYGKLLRDNVAIAFGSWRTQMVYGRLSWGVSYGWGVLLTCAAWYMVFKDRITLGESMALGMYIPILLRPVEEVLGLYRSLISASVAAERLSEILKAGRIGDRDRQPATTTDVTQVCLENVTFAYGDTPPCLRHISLRIVRGQRVVVLGPTGSGKTTLLKLLAGMYDRYQGRVLIDGHSLHTMSGAEHLARVAMVMPENFFFSGSVLANMQIANPRMSEHEIRAVAEQLGLDEWIAQLSQGYHTHLGVGGIRLSSGQAQKLGLLRALLKRPAILLLDEVTSAMDIESERRILDGLRMLSPPNAILVMTTHRLTITLEPWVDHVVVLKEGRILEEGSPCDLYARAGQYRRLMDFAGLGRLLAPPPTLASNRNA